MLTQEISLKVSKSLFSYLAVLAILAFVLLTTLGQVRLQYSILVLFSALFLQGINFLLRYFSQPKNKRNEGYLMAGLFASTLPVVGIGLALMELFKNG